MDLATAIANDLKCRVDDYLDEALVNREGSTMAIRIHETLTATRAALIAVEQSIHEVMKNPLFTEQDERDIAAAAEALVDTFGVGDTPTETRAKVYPFKKR